MAHKKGGGSSRNGRDSNSQRLGVKRFGGEYVIPGNIIVRQHGTKFFAGENTMIGRDHTIYAVAAGYVVFEKPRRGKKYISVYPELTPVAPAPSLAPVAVAALTKVKTPKAKPDAAEAPVLAKPAAVEAPAKARPAKPSGKDDLKLIEGIGPKVEKALNDAGITTFAQVAEMSADDLVRIVKVEAGVRIVGDAATWPRQAQLAAEGDMDALKKYQDELTGGRE
jgi:large subunit ribosomal protein L27